MPAKAFSMIFTFWTSRQIERILRNLEKKGAIKTGNYNATPYDRTKWYALSKSIKSIYEGGQIDLPKCENGKSKSDEPIPDNKPDTKTNNKQDNNINALNYNNGDIGEGNKTQEDTDKLQAKSEDKKYSNSKYFKESWEHHPRKIERLKVYSSRKARLKEKIDPQLLIKTCINYGQICARDKTNEKFMYHGDDEPIVDGRGIF